MCSIRLVCARPVRSFFSWSLNVDTHFAMRSAASFFNSSSMVLPLVNWKNWPAAVFVPLHWAAQSLLRPSPGRPSLVTRSAHAPRPWTAPFGSTSGRPNALLRVCRTSAPLPPAKGATFAGWTVPWFMLRKPGSLSRPGGDDGADVLALNDSHEVAGIEQVEHLQRQVIFPTHDDGRGVHHVEAIIQHLVKGQVRVALRLGIEIRIGIIDSVDLGGLQENLGINLDGAQAGRGVGGEEGIARAGAEYDDPPLLQMAHCPAPDIVLAYFVDPQRRHDPRIDPLGLERILHRQGVDDRGQHSHVIRGHSIHSSARQTGAAEDVAASQYHGHLHAHLRQVADFARNAFQNLRIDAVVFASQQRLSGQFDQNSAVACRGVGGSVQCGHGPVTYYKRPRMRGVPEFILQESM